MIISCDSLSLFTLSPFRWVEDWVWGLPLIVFTVVFHAVGMLLMSEKVEQLHKDVLARWGYPAVFVVTVGGSAMFAAALHGVESMIWATAYLLLGALPDYADAVLYSLGAMTTYGHASGLLARPWQLMGNLEALDGMLLFGLTTAFLFGIIQKIYELKNWRSR
jgi:hypothetical protein